jgi:uncharacterized membrane protein
VSTHDPKRLMKVLCAVVVLGGVAAIAFGCLAFWPARDLAKSAVSEREILDHINAGDAADAETPLGKYFRTTLQYHEALKGSYLSLAWAFVIVGGAFVVLGAWQLVLVRRLGGAP